MEYEVEQGPKGRSEQRKHRRFGLSWAAHGSERCAAFSGRTSRGCPRARERPRTG